uniref:Uncharacterized protein n=1 Tax=Romanomermis culicivorax TaxID=13658 RepID=A0A915KBW3_ROMCU
MEKKKNSEDQNEEAPLPKKKYLDELEMQQSGIVDKKGRRVPTVIEKNSLINGDVTTNPTKLTDEAKPIKGVDMIAAMRYKYEYLEYRIGDKGQAMTLWDDG